MQKIIYILIAAVLFACGTPTEKQAEEPVKIIEEITPKIVEELVEDQDGMLYGSFDGVVISKTPTYENPNENLEPNYHIPAGTFVIPEKGERMPAVQDNDECRLYGYHWYSVHQGADVPSWICGENLFLRSKAQSRFNNNMSRDEMDFGYKTSGSFYRFDMAASSFEDPGTGPTYCDGYGLPFMYQDDKAQIFPIIINEMGGELGFGFSLTPDGYLLILLDSDGGGAEITDFIEIESGFYEIYVTTNTQDSMSKVVLHVKESDGKFILTKMDITEG